MCVFKRREVLTYLTGIYMVNTDGEQGADKGEASFRQRCGFKLVANFGFVQLRLLWARKMYFIK